MPFIDSKITCKLTEAQKEILKNELGKLITIIPGKREEFLMIGFSDEYPLYFGGKKLDQGAFIEVRLFGTTTPDILELMTSNICTLYSKELNIPPDAIYINYEFVSHWGWNSKNF